MTDPLEVDPFAADDPDARIRVRHYGQPLLTTLGAARLTIRHPEGKAVRDRNAGLTPRPRPWPPSRPTPTSSSSPHPAAGRNRLMTATIRAVVSTVVAMACLTTFSTTMTPASAASAASAARVPEPRSEEWWLRHWQAQQKIWPISQGQGVIVAVIDGGVNAALPDLKGAVLPGGDIADGSTDGRVDLDVRRHGTGMATLIAGRGRGTRMMGIAPGAKILPVRTVDGTHRTGSPQTMGKAIRWAVDHGADVISISLGADSETELECEPERQYAVDYALEHDVVVIAGAGNTGHEGNPPTQPAGCPGVLAVGAVDRHGRPAPFTQRRPYVAIAAPGVGVGAERGLGFFDDQASGTSPATALTSGVIALMRARNPRMPAREILRRVVATADDVGPKGRDDASGYGRIQPYRALTATVPACVPNPVFARWEKSRRDRVAHPLPSRTPEVIPDPVPLRTRMIQAGAGVGATLALAGGLAGLIVLLFSRRSSRRPGQFEQPPPQWPGLGSPQGLASPRDSHDPARRGMR